MSVASFSATVRSMVLKDKTRYFINPAEIPSDVRDALCRNRYIGRDNLMFDVEKGDWRDTRNATGNDRFSYNAVIEVSHKAGQRPTLTVTDSTWPVR
jgi:hypothetical protein